MILAGSILYKEEKEIYMDRCADGSLKFYEKLDNEVFEEATSCLLEEWAVELNSPWSQALESYKISVNCKDGYTKVEDEEMMWKCVYKVVGYDGITATIIGYGEFPDKALQDCLMGFLSIQRKYNPNNDKI